MSLHNSWICNQCYYFNYEFQYKCILCYQHRFTLDYPLEIQVLCQEEILLQMLYLHQTKISRNMEEISYLIDIELVFNYYFFGNALNENR